jgi:hypothetical protein
LPWPAYSPDCNPIEHTRASLFAQIINQGSLNGSACLKTPAEQTSVYSSRESPILNLFCHSCRRTDAHFIRIQNAIISC